MTRNSIRKEIFCLLYQSLFYEKDEFDVILEQINNEKSGSDWEEIIKKVTAILKNLKTIDSSIQKASQNWKIERMSKVDISILRLGTYEMLIDNDIPTSIAINEAVNLAKMYSDSNSYKFINGVLGGIAKDSDKGNI